MVKSFLLVKINCLTKETPIWFCKVFYFNKISKKHGPLMENELFNYYNLDHTLWLPRRFYLLEIYMYIYYIWSSCFKHTNRSIILNYKQNKSDLQLTFLVYHNYFHASGPRWGDLHFILIRLPRRWPFYRSIDRDIKRGVRGHLGIPLQRLSTPRDSSGSFKIPNYLTSK